MTKETLNQLYCIVDKNKDKSIIEILSSLLDNIYECNINNVSKKIEECYLRGCKI